ncbi:helix-turn-helix transcriptional regulator [Asanoa sp. WMMD1127]|uniref:helix-turn-helix transcriptional regulator n=1 Tax=Asanoa sp. WMMD1127 TaxID=3016107 RepID=UPI0024161DAE|nr:helix-turn-helix transcriptional regulator [Asanoa sp. WMMD1127]MDG4826596.1 helix-turn-helix transcriptional regulator [Asanoa sp. WMMD1127]
MPAVRRRLALTAALVGCFLWAMIIMGLAFAFVERGAEQWWLVFVFGAVVLVVAVAVTGAFRRGSPAARPTEATADAAATAPPVGTAIPASEPPAYVSAIAASAPVASGATMTVSPPVAGGAEMTVSPGAGGAASSAVPVEQLSPREHEVLGHLAAGRSNREIAAALHLAQGTVKAHLNHIFRKLGATTRLQAVARARDAGLLDK